MEKKYTIFTGKMLGSYNLIDMIFGASYIILMTYHNLSSLNISFVMALSSLSLALFDYPSGNFADIYGRKKSTAIGFLIWGIGLIMFSLSKTLLFFSVATIISSLGIALISGSPVSWYIDKLKSIGKMEYKNKAIPILNGVLSLFSAIGATIAALSNMFSTFNPLFIAGIFSIIISVTTYIFFEDNYGERLSTNFVGEIVQSTKKFFKDKAMNKILIYYMIQRLPLTAFIVVWQLYFLLDLDGNPEFIGFALIMFMIAGSISGFLSAKLVTKYSNYNLTILAKIINIVALFSIFLIGNNIINFAVLVFIYEFGLGLENANRGAWMQDLIPSEKRSTYYSAMGAINSAFIFVCILLLGKVMVTLGREFIWIIAGLAQILSLLYLVIYIGKYIKNRKGV
ncbi:MAG: MFS transporter [Defluviitaleaceae bacterium]|nr:MFS transporter [Defluviitaleaceae bacterium]